MRRPIIIGTMLLVIIISLVSFFPAVGGSAREVTGSSISKFDDIEIYASLSIQELSPTEAKGNARVQLFVEGLGWRRWRADAICIAFGPSFDGAPSASYVLQFTEIGGWGTGEVGQYYKLWTADGGTPGAFSDMVGNVVVPAVDVQPSCDFELPFEYWPSTGGNLVIHNYP